MADQRVFFNEENKRIWEAVDDYFSKAGDDSARNMYDIRNYMSRVGDAFTVMAFPWVVSRIEREGYETVRMAAYGTPGELLDLRIFAVTERSMRHLRDVVATFGAKAGASLTAQIMIAAEEDEMAIAACLLASDFLPTLEGMPREVSRTMLASLVETVEGTSCKMSIAWVLYKMGVKKYWEELVFGSHFLRPEFLRLLQEFGRAANPRIKEQDLKDRICTQAAAGEYPDLPVPITETQKRGLLRTVALDIASDGAAYNKAPKWKRKPVIRQAMKE